MQAKDAGKEHHSMGERKGGSEERSGSEDIINVHVALPGVAQLLIKTVGLHFNLLLVEGVDGLEEVVVEFRILLLFLPSIFSRTEMM